MHSIFGFSMISSFGFNGLGSQSVVIFLELVRMFVVKDFFRRRFAHYSAHLRDKEMPNKILYNTDIQTIFTNMPTNFQPKQFKQKLDIVKKTLTSSALTGSDRFYERGPPLQHFSDSQSLTVPGVFNVHSIFDKHVNNNVHGIPINKTHLLVFSMKTSFNLSRICARQFGVAHKI